MERALELDPYFLGTKVLMAENFATKLDDEEMFDRLLQEVLDADLATVPEEIQPEMTIEKEKRRLVLGDRAQNVSSVVRTRRRSLAAPPPRVLNHVLNTKSHNRAMACSIAGNSSTPDS